MPWFKRRGREPKRAISKDVESRIYRRIADLPVDEAQKREFSARVAGAIMAANASLDLVPELRLLWRATDEQMVGVVKFYTLAMLSRWARKVWRGQLAQSDYSVVLPTMATNTLNFFGSRVDGDVAEFLAVDAQFNADRNRIDVAIANDESVLSHVSELDLLAALVARELGRPLTSDIVSLDLPVEDLFDLLAAGWKPVWGDSVEGLLAFQQVILDAEIWMFDFHRNMVEHGGA